MRRQAVTLLWFLCPSCLIVPIFWMEIFVARVHWLSIVAKPCQTSVPVYGLVSLTQRTILPCRWDAKTHKLKQMQETNGSCRQHFWDGGGGRTADGGPGGARPPAQARHAESLGNRETKSASVAVAMRFSVAWTSRTNCSLTIPQYSVAIIWRKHIRKRSIGCLNPGENRT